MGFQLGSADREPSGATYQIRAKRAIVTAGAYTNDVLRPLKLQLNIKVGRDVQSSDASGHTGISAPGISVHARSRRRRAGAGSSSLRLKDGLASQTWHRHSCHEWQRAPIAAQISKSMCVSDQIPSPGWERP